MNVVAHVHIKDSGKRFFEEKGLYGSLFSNLIDEIQRCSFVDEICLWADPKTSGSGQPFYKGIPVHQLDAAGFYPSQFPEPMAWGALVKSHPAYLSKGPGDLWLYLDPDHLLFNADALEKMYDLLLEDERAHVIYPVYKVDPHLYIKMGGPDDLVPVWSYPGLDRQKYPQLYRKVGLYLYHPQRLQYKKPLSELYHLVPWFEGKKYRDREGADFATYMASKKQAKGNI